MTLFLLCSVDRLIVVCVVLIWLSLSVQSSSSFRPFQRNSLFRELSVPVEPYTGAVVPTSIWEHDVTTAVALSVDGLSLFVGLSYSRNPNLLVRSNLRGVISANTSLTPNLPITLILPSLSSVFVRVSDGRRAYLIQVDLRSFTQVNSFEVPARYILTGVDQRGEVLLVEDKLSTVLATIDARTGAQLSTYDGGLTLGLAGSAFSPDGDLLFTLNLNNSVNTADNTDKQYFFVAGIRSNNTPAYVFPLPSICEFIVSAAIDASGQYAYAVYVTQLPRNYSGTVVIAQFDLATGEQLTATSLDFAEYYGVDRISPALRSMDMYFLRTVQDGQMQHTSIVFLHGTNATAISVSMRGMPQLEEPSQVATAGTGVNQRIYVGLNSSPRSLVQLDGNGKLLASYSAEDDLNECGIGSPLQGIAVASSGTVYFPLCNGSLLVLSSRLEVVRRVDLAGDRPRLRSVAPSADDRTVWVTNDDTPAQISLYDTKSGSMISHLTASPSSWFVDVKLGGNGSIWAIDNNASCIVHWASNGTMLSSFSYTSYAGFMSLVSLAVDETHSRLVVTGNLIDWEGTSLINSTLVWVDMRSGAVQDTFLFESNEEAYGVAMTDDGMDVFAPSIATGWMYHFRQNPAMARVKVENNLGHTAQFE